MFKITWGIAREAERVVTVNCCTLGSVYSQEKMRQLRWIIIFHILICEISNAAEWNRPNICASTPAWLWCKYGSQILISNNCGRIIRPGRLLIFNSGHTRIVLHWKNEVLARTISHPPSRYVRSASDIASPIKRKSIPFVFSPEGNSYSTRLAIVGMYTGMKFPARDRSGGGHPRASP